MTTEMKKAWLEKATAKELVDQHASFLMRYATIEFGKEYLELAEDIRLTQEELLKRLNK